jgi:hypothetical protein
VVVNAFVVPDEISWALWGHDLEAEGYSVAGSPETAEVLLAPESLPEGLSDAVVSAWAAMPRRRRLMTLPAPLTGGADVRALVDGRQQHPAPDEQGHGAHEHEHEGHEGHEGHVGHVGHEGHEGHDEHDAHDHSAMMEVTGDPSADGLVMEDLEFDLGPLSAVLPGGVVATFSLDGDLVGSCALQATLVSPDPAVPDPLARAAWSATRASPGRRIFEVELERAVSHAAWLGRLGRVLGWAELVDDARAILGPALAARRGQHDALPGALREAERVHGRLDGSRRLGFRLRDRAVVDRAAVGELGLTGPVARAAGAPADARTRDPAYSAAGFMPAVREAGDAEARTLVRLEEIAVSLGLAIAAADAAADVPAGPAIEGPRGPLRRDGSSGGREAPGTAALLRVAGERAAGLEWSHAVVALTSFDLSGWRVAG